MTRRPGVGPRLRAGERLVGLFTMFSEPALVEMAGYSGFDFVIVDTEHGPPGHEDLHNCLRAADAAALDCLVRVPRGALGDIQRILDAGAAGIVAPHVSTAAEAAEIVDACHLPPVGHRGTAFTARSGSFGLAAREEVLEAAAAVAVVVMVEDAEGLSNARAIAQTPGVDCVFAGPADLAASLGFGPEDADRVRAIIRSDIGRVAASVGTRWGSFVAGGADAAELDADGAVMFAVSGTSLIRDGLVGSINEFRELRREDA
jgi:4-hydroxy-2-oxoheptanedioate aldolase